MLLQLGQILTFVASSIEMAEEIKKNHDLVFSSWQSQTGAKRLFYGFTDVAFAPYGEYWRQMRKICVLELLSVKQVNSFRSIMEEEVGWWTRLLPSSTSGLPGSSGRKAGINIFCMGMPDFLFYLEFRNGDPKTHLHKYKGNQTFF